MPIIAKPLPSVERLDELFDVNYQTGIIIWKRRTELSFKTVRAARTWNGRFAGNEAGSLNSSGYLKVDINASAFAVHRIMFKMFYRIEPILIDHINGVVSDNRICNLRSVDSKENRKNCRLSRLNSSGVIGVHFCKTQQRWIASIGGSRKTLGIYIEKADAIKRRDRAEIEFGYHKNHGRK